MALDSDSVVHILLVGPPASAKTMFLTSLMHHLKSSYFADGANSTKAGMIDYLFENRPRYLLIDEIQLWEIHKYNNGLLMFNEVKSPSTKEPITTIAKNNAIAKKVTEEIRPDTWSLIAHTGWIAKRTSIVVIGAF
jgi:ATP-dependent protease Clp ATPase subunit